MDLAGFCGIVRLDNFIDCILRSFFYDVLLLTLKDLDLDFYLLSWSDVKLASITFDCTWAARSAPQTWKIIQHMWSINLSLGLLRRPFLFHCSAFLRPFYILASVHEPATIIPRWACLALLLELFSSPPRVVWSHWLHDWKVCWLFCCPEDM